MSNPKSPSTVSNREIWSLSHLTALCSRALEHLQATVANPTVRVCTQLALITILFSTPAVAQTDVGNIYCGTPVETGITVIFGAIAALGLPAGMFYTGRSGLSYMRSTGDPNRQETARRDLILSGVGLAVVIMALVAPEIITKFGDQIGFSFSDCVTPFSGSSHPF